MGYLQCKQQPWILITPCSGRGADFTVRLPWQRGLGREVLLFLQEKPPSAKTPVQQLSRVCERETKVRLKALKADGLRKNKRS